MIREDRVALNERFRKVFGALEDKGIIKKNDRAGKGIGDIAEIITGNRKYGHLLRAYLDPTSKRVIDYHEARAFCRHFAEFGVNESYVVDGLGKPFGEAEQQVPRFQPKKPSSVQVRGSSILYTNMEAFAGSTIGADSFSYESNKTFVLPGLTGNGLVAFPVSGNSMDPVIQNGDILICRLLTDLREIKENQIYAVRNNGQVWVKYVQPIEGKSQRIVRLKLLSANYIENDPFIEEVNESTQIFKVVRRICEM